MTSHSQPSSIMRVKETDNLAILNLHRKTLPGPRLLHELISPSAKDDLAIDFLLANERRVSLTYESLETTSLILARQIRQLLPTLNDEQHIVPVIIPQSPELYIAWRAVLQAGACFCPIQPDVPPERLKFIVGDVSAKLILCLQDQVARTTAIIPQVPHLSVSSRALLQDGKRRRDIVAESATQIGPQSLAYVMYTSGSTGLPKGVKVSHHSITQSLLAHQGHIPKFKRFLQFASPTFDVSVFEIFFPFLRGATVVGCSRERMLTNLSGTIVKMDVDAAELTPTVAGSLLRTRSAAPCLKLLLTIGEMLTKSVVDEFGGSDHRESLLYAAYGPTEAAVHCTIAPRLRASASVRSIGEPLSTVTTFILKEAVDSESVQIAQMGEAGELAVAGQLATGYLNRPDQNATSFVSLPEYGQVYRTGDRAICYPNGSLEILGRIGSSQVKLRGQRVELGEIEEVAARTQGVSMAVALTTDDNLLLFYETHSDTPPSDVKAVCKDWLPPFMRPGEVIRLRDGFPRLPSGKIDRKSLEQYHRIYTSTQRKQPDPDFASNMERELGAAFENELGISLSRTSDLWAHGLDSLRAISILSYLRPTFPGLSITGILESQNIIDLAKRAADIPAVTEVAPERTYQHLDGWDLIRASVEERLQAEKDHLAGFFPCSSVQVAMLAETSANPKLNFNSITLKTPTDTSEAALWDALSVVAEKNDILRSGFVFTESVSVPFVRLVWNQLRQHELDLLHPLRLTTLRHEESNMFTLQIHHALYDGWSWELILDDLNAVLSNFILGARPSFEIFNSYQLRQSENRCTEDLRYWKELLQDHSVTKFPNISGSNVANDNFREASVRRLELPLAHLADVAARFHVARQSFLQAAWAILLSDYTDSLEVLFGIVNSGRHSNVGGIDQIIGPCLSTLPFPINLSTLRTFKDLVLAIQRQWLESLEHSDTFSRDIKKPTGQKLGGIFDNILVWQEGISRPSERRQHVTTHSTEDALDYTLVLEAEPVGNDIRVKLTANSSKIPRPQAALILHQFDVILSRIVLNPEGNINTSWQASPEHLLSIANPSFTPLQATPSLTTAIESLSKLHPERPAIKFVEHFDPITGKVSIQTLSYGGLLKTARLVSANLINKVNVQPDTLVGIIAEKSPDLYIVILGTVMAGAGYLCIDPRTPSDRVCQILKHAGCAAVLSGDSLEVGYLQSEIETVNIQNLLQRTTSESGATIPRQVSLQDVAYSVFTSGTSGTPKGVFITRENLLSNIETLSRIYPHRQDGDCLLQACSPAFDVSVFEIFWTWHVGMTLCSASNDVLFRDIERFIDVLGCTHLSMTPSVAALIHPRNVPKVKMLVTAGEPMNSKVFDTWADHGLFQGYGPSETTNICNVKANVSKRHTQNNVGPALENTSIFVCSKISVDRPDGRSLDSALSVLDFKPVPRGAVGEIWIGGDQVGKGYTDPNLTAQSFLEHPRYGRLYRSGDLGRLLFDDTLEILGRQDDQVKLRGLRIELGDVNSTLIRNGWIKDAVSIMNCENGRSRLLSFCVVKGNRSPRELQALIRGVFNQLETSLPSYMVPDMVFPVSNIPLTRQGKVDKRALLEDLASRPSEEVRFSSRRQEESSDASILDETGKRIRQALREALGVSDEHVHANSSFYALGIDSISCIRLSQSLVRHGFPRVDVSTILRHPSIELLSPFLDGNTSRSWTSTSGKHASLSRLFDASWMQGITSQLCNQGFTIHKFWPCTDLQSSILSTSEQSISDAYQNTLRFGITGNIDRLKHAWMEVVSRNDLLRSVFIRCPSPATPYAQLVLKDWEATWNGSKLERSRPHLNDILHTDPFCLSIVADPKGQSELKLEIHHALYDAEAMSCLLLEVEAIYSGRGLTPASSFENYLTHMIDFDPKTVRDFWSEKLRGNTPRRLADHIPIALKSEIKTGVSVKSTCSTPVDVLHNSAMRQKVSVLSMLQSALSRVLFGVFETFDVCFGNVFSGRNLPIEGIEHMTGPCFNTLPIRVQAKDNTSNRQLAASLNSLNADILPFQTNSPRVIQRFSGSDSGPLFDILLLLQKRPVELDLSVWRLLEDSGTMSFPFILEVEQDEESNSVKAILHSEVATVEILQNLLDCFDELLENCTRYPEAAATDLSLVQSRLSLYKLNPTTSVGSYQNGRGLEKAINSGHWSPVEKTVAKVVLALSPLEKPTISKQTTLFRLGLDSINAVQIAAGLRKMGYAISSSDIMEAPAISDIAARCLAPSTHQSPQEGRLDLKAFDTQGRDFLKSMGIDLDNVESLLPCTPTQSGILAQHIHSNGQLYYNSLSLTLNRDIDTAKLRHCWLWAVERHEMLRTGFVECSHHDYPFMMITYSAKGMKLPWTDSPSRAAHSEDKAWPKFDIKQLLTPPWKIQLRNTESSKTLALSMLHALYDAQALDIILADVVNHYLGRKVNLVGFISATVSRILAQAESDEARSFWEDESRRMQPTKFPDLNILQSQKRTSSVAMRHASMSLTSLQDALAGLGCSLQAACQAAWAKVLCAYTGQSRVTFGMILSGRNFEDERNDSVFPCINMLPCSFDVRCATFELLAQISDLNATLLRLQHTPLTSIKRWQGLGAETFDTALVLQKFESRQPQQVPWSIDDDAASAEYAFSLEVLPDQRRDELTFRATYSKHVVPSEAASMILDQFDEFVREAVDMRPASINRRPCLSILPPKQDRLHTRVRVLHEMVEDTVHRVPDLPALEFVDSFDGSKPVIRSFSYSQLDRAANQIAHLILQNGAKTGDLIATCFDKCPEASFVTLGILKAGCAYVAIDPGAPVDRKRFIIDDSGSKLVLTTHDKTSGFSSMKNVAVIAVDDNTRIHQLPSSRPDLLAPLDPQSTCYCLYTSGTTGTPKGCLISHDNVVQAMLAFEKIFSGHWSSKSRWLQFASFHFDVSVLEQYWSWYVGISVVSASRDLMFEDLPGFIQKMQITHLDLTPSLARLLTPEDVPSLCEGVFIVGGEQVTEDIIETWGDAGCLYNFYGPSEVTIGCTVRPRVSRNTKPTNIGQPWDNVGAFVLEPATNQAVVRGAVGELCLSGMLVGKGYLNRPDLTAKSFVTLDNHGEQVYRSGDLVRLLHDDSFEFLGRIDDQVKLRGQRLEIGEINQVVQSSSSSIKSVATIIARHPKQGGEHLVTFWSTFESKHHQEGCQLVMDSTAQSLSAQIRRHCMDKLPGYMVPSKFLAVNFMPLTVNNKVDRRGLGLLYGDMVEKIDSQQTPEAPASAAFSSIAEILASYFHQDKNRITPASSLFELGLDSISVIGLARKLRAAGYTALNISTVMRKSTVADLVEAAAVPVGEDRGSEYAVAASSQTIRSFARKHKETVIAALQVEPDAIESIAPCTALQEGMISKASNSEPQAVTYWAQFHYDIRGNVDLESLREAWRAVEKSTSILRTHFIPTADGHAQVVLRPHSDVSGVENGYGPWAKDMFHSWILQTKGFSRALPWRLLISPTWGKTYMTLFIFHGLYDGISLGLLLEKVAGVYKSSGKDSSISNFYEWLPRGPLCVIPSAEQFWTTKLKQTQNLGLVVKHELNQPRRRPVKSTLQRKGISDLCRTLEITPPALFQATWLLVLYRVYGIIPTLGLVVSGRSLDDAEAENIIGPMFNTIPSGMGEIRGSELSDLARACHQFNVDVLEYQHTPLRDINKWLGLDPRESLIDNLFVFQKEQSQTTEQANLWSVMTSDAVPDYPVNLEVEQKVDGTFGMTLFAKEEYLNVSETSSLLGAMCDLLKMVAQGETVMLPPAFLELNEKSSRDRDRIIANRFDADHETTERTVLDDLVRQHLAGLSGLEASKIGLQHPSLFELGLDSIDMMKLSARLRSAGYRIAVRKMMQSPTVAGIARACEYIDRKDYERDFTPQDITDSRFDAAQPGYRDLLSRQGFTLDGVNRILPVTAMQEGLLLDYEEYYNVFVFQLEDHVDIKRLKQAWQRVIHDQSILRTRFVAIENPHSDVSFLQVVDRPGKVTASIAQDFARVFNIRETVALMKKHAQSSELADLRIEIRFFGVSDAGNGYTKHMILGLHHALYDAWSIDLLHREVSKAYVQRQKVSTTSDTSAHVSYERHLEAVTTSNVDAESKTFWTTQLKDSHPTTLKPTTPTPIPTPASPALAPPAQLLRIPSHLSLPQATQFCKHHGITLQSFGLAIWSLTLAHSVRSRDVCFGLVLSGRTTEGAESLVYPTFNTVVFRNRIGGVGVDVGDDGAEDDDSGLGFLRRTHDLVVQVSGNQHFPLREALKLAGEKEKGKRAGIFDTLFTYQKIPELEDDSERVGERLYYEEELDGGEVSPPYAVNVEMQGRDGVLWWTVATQAGVVERSWVEELVKTMEDILGWLIERTNSSILEVVDGNTSICGLTPREMVREDYGDEDVQGGHLDGDEDADEYVQDQAMEDDEHGSMDEAPDDDPWTSTETTIRHVLAEVSRTEISKITKTTGIFELGLDSISAIKVTGLLGKNGMRIPVSKIIESQSVEKMARIAGGLGGDGDGDGGGDEKKGMPQQQQLIPAGDVPRSLSEYTSVLQQHGLDIKDVECVFPATAGQRYMLEIWATSSARLFYPSFWLKITNTKREQFDRAINSLAEKIPMLRTTFVSASDGLLQVTITNHAAQKMRMRLPWSCTVREEEGGGGEGLLVTLKIHHALYDAVSLKVMLDGLWRLCRDDGQASDKFGVDQTAFLSVTQPQSEEFKARQKDFWMSYLSPPSGKAICSATGQRGSFEADRRETFNPHVLRTSRVEEVLRQHSISIQALFLAVCGRLYTRFISTTDIDKDKEKKHEDSASHVLIGLYLANRSLDVTNLPDLAAPTVNIVPLMVNVDGRVSLVDAAREVQRDLARIGRAENCGVGLGEVWEWTGRRMGFVVNFLRVPGDGDGGDGDNEGDLGDGDGDGSKSKDVGISHVTGALRESMMKESMDLDGPGPFFGGDGAGFEAHQLDWCFPSIDVEAKVEDGWLAVGVFAPEDMLDEQGVKGLVDGIEEMLSLETAKGELEEEAEGRG